MAYELTSFGTTLADEPLEEQSVEVVQARANGTLGKWMLAGAGIGAGYLLGRWLIDRKSWHRNPMPWTTLSIGSGYWIVFDGKTGETLGYVLRMNGYFSAHTEKQAVIGTMPSLPAAAGLVYGRFYEKFSGADTLVDIHAPNPDYRIDMWTTNMGRVYVGSKQVAMLTNVASKGWVIAAPGAEPKGYFATPEKAAAWFFEPKRAEVLLQEDAKKALEEAREHREKTERKEQRRQAQERREDLPDEELDHRIIITLYRSKVKGKTYKRAPSGVEYSTPQQLQLPKRLTVEEIAKKVKAPRDRVLTRARALARAKKIYGISGYRKTDVPTTKTDAKGRKVMTFEKARRKMFWFAAFGPAGEVGFFAPGEHKLPEENPEQSAFDFGEKQYEVRERKPIARSTGSRMRYTKWERVGMYDALSAAKKATHIWHSPQTGREWQKQRSIFFEGKRVSDGARLLPKYRDLPEQP